MEQYRKAIKEIGQIVMNKSALIGSTKNGNTPLFEEFVLSDDNAMLSDYISESVNEMAITLLKFCVFCVDEDTITANFNIELTHQQTNVLFVMITDFFVYRCIGSDYKLKGFDAALVVLSDAENLRVRINALLNRWLLKRRSYRMY